MKLLLLGLTTLALLFALNVNGQTYSKEQLKILEQEVNSVKTDTTSFTLEQLKISEFDLVASRAFQFIDSLSAFVSNKKSDRINNFETDIVPYLVVNCNELNLTTLHFSEDEALLYDSFLQVLRWDNAIGAVELYKSFIFNNEDALAVSKSILTVLSFVKYLRYYSQSKESSRSENDVYRCILENFEHSNEIDWKVFALNPGKLIFWTIAACVWETKSEK